VNTRKTNPRRRHVTGQPGPTDKEREYLAVIYYLRERDEPVIAARLARWMGVQPPTVTHIVQQLREKGCVVRSDDGELTLTTEGMALAEAAVRRHRILECFLLHVLHMSWHLVHEEALRLEHALSPTLESRITDLVGDTPYCPHGNPIPGSGASMNEHARLDTVAEGTRFRVRRISEEAEEDSSLLRYLQDNGLMPDAQVTVVSTSAAYGVSLRRGPHTLTVSPEIATVLWGEPVTTGLE
jgi:DtxR family Mn-dependent transcriptional regulator